MAAVVSEDVWSEQDTNPDAIEAALRELLRERHAANQALAPARVLNLIVIVDRSWKGEIANRLERVGRYHASRTILCAVEEGRETLDAVAVMTFDEPKNGGIGVMHEQVEIDMGPGHLSGLETIVDPVVVSELPTVVWAPHGHEEAVNALRDIIDVMLLDSDDMPDPSPALVRAQAELELAYVVDLAWLRTTPWRERLAASFDPMSRREGLRSLDGRDRAPPGELDGERTAPGRLALLAAALGHPAACVREWRGFARPGVHGGIIAVHRHPPGALRAGSAGTGRGDRRLGGREQAVAGPGPGWVDRAGMLARPR